MSLIEEHGIIVTVDGSHASVAPLQGAGCHSCASSGVCGTTILAPLFAKNKRLLMVENAINAQPGEEVVIGLNKMAVIIASLAVYLMPLLALALGAIAGKYLALAMGLEDGEIVSIFSGLGAAILTFFITRRVLNSAYFSAFLVPVMISHGVDE